MGVCQELEKFMAFSPFLILENSVIYYHVVFTDICWEEKARLEMDGSFTGNILGIGYYLIYQFLAIGVAYRLLAGEKKPTRILLGSVFGSVCMMWLPAIFSLGLGFGKDSHLLAVTAMVLLSVGILQWQKKTDGSRKTAREEESWKEHAYLLLVIPLMILFTYLLSTHTIPCVEDGSFHTGQSTYGDMNMHFSFITSIARQGTFPPEYSLLPGTKLSYPFLCDTISSSLLLFGGSLRAAYIFPMLIAALQLMTGVLMLGRGILNSRRKAMLAWAFFFFNGGFGVLYFLKGVTKDATVFTQIFTEFYKTPTNLVDKNIRWVNIVVDMILPQRATLFGWAVLIPVIFLLYRGIQLEKRSYFVGVGVLAGSLPMIHTHSFLALGCICAMWLIYSLRTEVNPAWKMKESKIELLVLFFFFLVMCSLDFLRRRQELSANLYMGLGMAVVAAVTVICLVLVFRGWKKKGKDSLIVNWGILLGIVVVLALPQLIFWTFSQAQGDQFLRGHFNWGNISDTYLMFYLKNMGIVWVLGIVSLIFTRSRNYFIVVPAFFIWTLLELMLFQPNEYDNNKLLYIAYLFLCMFVADYVIEICQKIKGRIFPALLVTILLFISSISALLTMGREIVSDYELYSADEVRMCRYIEKNTQPEDVILTDTRHNNGVVSLTGRNIVCGSSSFLYYHGVDYAAREQDVAAMYGNPGDMTLYDKYDVDYVYICNSERYNYSITSEDAFLENFQLVHQEGSVNLYKRTDK